MIMPPDDEKTTSTLFDLLDQEIIKVIGNGMRCDNGETDPSETHKEQLLGLARVLRKHPDNAVEITGFSEQPWGPWSTPELCKALSLERARRLRERLTVLGCANKMACEGRGFVDGLGGRCQVKAISLERAMENEAKHLEEDMEEISIVQKKLDDVLGETNVPFEAGYVRLKVQGKEMCDNLASVMKLHPRIGLKIIGYTGRPGHTLTPTQKVCEDLSLRRAQVVKDHFKEAGCKCEMYTEGRGHVDEKGPRIELVTCSVEDVEEALASEPTAEITEAPKKATRGVQISFQTKDGNDVRDVTFVRRPIGMKLGNFAPLTVTQVTPQGHAKQLGVRVGMVVRMISCKSVMHLDIKEARAVLDQELAGLPESG